MPSTHKPITTELSESVLHFAPESGPASFGITVYNDSDRFASFQVGLVAPGAESNRQDWYRFSPSVSAKIPPGDRTQFQAHLLAVPPVPGGFTGTMNLTVRVYSTELRDEDRKDLRLIISGEGLLLPKIILPEKQFKVQPQAQLDIQANVYNPNRKSLEAVLELKGLPSEWLPEGLQKGVVLLPGEERQVTFRCLIPPATEAPSGLYSLNLELVKPATSAPSEQILLEVLPEGFAEFQCEPYEQWIPLKSGRWMNPLDGEAAYTLTFQNSSNVALTGTVSVLDEAAARQTPQKRRSFRLPGRAEPEATEAEATSPLPSLPSGLTLDKEHVNLPPGQAGSLELRGQKPLPWLGWSRLKRYQVQAHLVDTPLDLRNDTQTLDLHILPVIPVWLQALSGLAGIFLAVFLWWWLAERGHTQPVHTVQFNGTGTEVVSGASDQTLRRWQVAGRGLRRQGVIDRGDKAVRVVQYRPVNNNWVASGLENGTIQLQNLLSNQTSTLESDRDDRVFGLVFDQDARTLWSAHGSGTILKWGLPADLGLASQATPEPAIEADFAVSAIALVGGADRYLTLGGRYQEFVLVDLQAEEGFNMPYRSGTQTDYINSLDVAAEQPMLLAAGDSQGYVSLWDMDACIQSPTDCEPISEWLGHGGAAVRSVALSPNGCHLVSAGDDGRVRLWSLTGAGELRPDRLEGQVLRRSGQPLNAVDIQQRSRQLQVVSGGDDHAVRLHRVRLKPDDQCRSSG
ncbi:MAG: hypothetical protein AAF773_16000 [Cyanobacteria bacterium P01_D01_bin.115]